MPGVQEKAIPRMFRIVLMISFSSYDIVLLDLRLYIRAGYCIGITTRYRFKTFLGLYMDSALSRHRRIRHDCENVNWPSWPHRLSFG
jgi:hypothetical protein